VVFLTALMTGRITKILVAGPFETDQAMALAVTSPAHAGLVVRAKWMVTLAALSVVGGLPLVGIALKLTPAFPAAFLACGAAAYTRLRLALSRPVQTRRGGLQGRMPATADGLLGVMIDIGWGIVGAILTIFI